MNEWAIHDDEFRRCATHGERLKFLLRYAVLAPSVQNTQPWAFRVTPDGIEVYADTSRRLLVIDPADREMLISIGAAITNLRVAAAHFGYETTVMYERRPEETMPLGFVSCIPGEGDPRLAALFPAIQSRHTNRETFDALPIDPAALETLCDVVVQYPDTFQFVRPHELPEVVDLVDMADRALMQRPAVRAELADWLRPDDLSEDGVPSDSGRIAAPLAALNGYLLRSAASASVQATHDRRLAATASAFVVVSSKEDRISLLRTGQILERLLLTITAVGLQYSFLNQPAEASAFRGRLGAIAGSPAPPQLMLRIGHPDRVAKPVRRRGVEQVLVR
jgi:hypothetical protein